MFTRSLVRSSFNSRTGWMRSLKTATPSSQGKSQSSLARLFSLSLSLFVILCE